ncbi:MAG: hypothetical protein ACE5KH_01670 [Candidatus Geothermarchaeales archaeon]
MMEDAVSKRLVLAAAMLVAVPAGMLALPAIFASDGEPCFEYVHVRNDFGEIRAILEHPCGEPLPEGWERVEEPGGCIQVIAWARNPGTGEIVFFPTPCDVPLGWEILETPYLSSEEE